METPSRDRNSQRISWWRLPLLLVFVLAAILAWRGGGLLQPKSVKKNPIPVRTENSAGQQVLLTVDFGTGEKKELISVPWREGMTVADLMNSAGNISIDQRGSGQGAFLTSINDVSNQGADGKNWIFEVNEREADRSFAVYELHPGDRVLWTFGLQR